MEDDGLRLTIQAFSVLFGVMAGSMFVSDMPATVNTVIIWISISFTVYKTLQSLAYYRFDL